MTKRFGDWFSYDKNPRAQIFRSTHDTVKDKDTMYYLLRYTTLDTVKDKDTMYYLLRYTTNDTVKDKDTMYYLLRYTTTVKG